MTHLLTILSYTPNWVFLVLAGLIYLGLKLCRPVSMSGQRIILLPVMMTLLTLMSIKTSFGLTPTSGACWFAGLAAALTLWLTLAPTPRVTSVAGQYLLPGSPVPLILMLAIFVSRYLVNYSLATTQDLSERALFVLPVCLVYGAFGGIFIARALKLLISARSQTSLSSQG
ncbi:hypothetical protein LZP73_10280 [Shewanella sp. AS16]|uniref:DUF6622 family protein n=1 Tax=Shewanella sp. AS16 TaxID=2907625 RepID=UPI001F2655DB|nr:DUF6622 family protein [Shewanella sp. AS16]MCE9686592.1 hypothetical protein [Shewanella sp. AS16]